MNLKPSVATLCCVFAFLAGCGGSGINDKTEVSVTYELKVDGKLVEKQDTPVTYNINTYPVKGLYEALKGKKPGDSLKIIIPPEKGYGMPQKDQIYAVPMDTPAPPKVGDKVNARNKKGVMAAGIVTKVDPKSMEIDFNSPYAGKTLEYDLKVRGAAPYRPK